MKGKSTLEEYVSYGVYGTPEIKKDEKIRYLGLFRESVIKVLTFQEIENPAGIFYFKLALKEPYIDRIIIHQDVNIGKRRGIIAIAQEKNLELSIVDSTDFIGDIAVVLASREAINRPDIDMKNKPEIPEVFKKNLGKALCKKCMNQAKAIHPDLSKEFKTLSIFDRMIGIKCPICQEKEKK